MPGGGIEISVEQNGLARVALRLKTEEGGAILRRELIADLRAAVAPAVEQVKGNARGIASSPRAAHTKKNIAGSSATSLGDAIARGVSTQVRLTAGAGKAVGVSIKAKKTGMPRDFINAPKRFNAKQFRRRVYGRAWVEQVGRPGWFDDPLHADKATYRAACIAAVERMARRIAR
jgi:hypothetical protein